MPGKADSAPPAGKPENSEERRQYIRSHVLWSAAVMCPDGEIEGMVMNMSVNGALVRVEKPVDGPAMTSLRIPQFGDFPGEVVWQKRGSIGVKFLESPHNVARSIENVLPECMVSPENVKASGS